jgi:hypothetical protein
MELSKATVEAERTILQKEEFWENASANYTDDPLQKTFYYPIAKNKP